MVQVSGARKEILMKTVIQAIPTYTMSVFLLPQHVCTEIESLISKYWCSSSNKDGGIHWKRWSLLSLDKNKGGLSFKNLRDFNLAMLGKQG